MRISVGRSVCVGVLLVATVLTFVACNGDADARAIWKDVLEKCAETELMSKDALFLGTSSTLGPGTILRLNQSGAYSLQWRSEDVAFPTDVVEPGAPASCTGNRTVTSKITPSLDVSTLVPGLGAEVSADVKKGREVTVSVGAWQMDQLVAGPAEAAIRDKAISDEAWNDIVSAQRYMISTAVLVHGLTSEIKYDSATAASLKAKYSQPGGVEVGAGFRGEWTSKGTLKITSENAFYIAADILKVNATGLSAEGSLFEKVTGLAELEFADR